MSTHTHTMTFTVEPAMIAEWMTSLSVEERLKVLSEALRDTASVKDVKERYVAKGPAFRHTSRFHYWVPSGIAIPEDLTGVQRKVATLLANGAHLPVDVLASRSGHPLETTRNACQILLARGIVERAVEAAKERYSR